jgi:NAD-dependent SIR2 family protein deacetylase
MRFLNWSCRHSWSFPRRWPEFQGKRNVDVQTCSKCGARRESPVQFGAAEPASDHGASAEQQFAEVRA